MARRGPEIFPFERIFKTAVLSGEGGRAVPKLLARIDDPDAAVRFWAVIGLTNAAGMEMKTAKLDDEAVDALRRTLSDPAVEVRIAAAEVLCRIGREKEAVPVLVDALGDESDWVRLESANALDRIGEKARLALPAMKEAVEDQSKENLFVRWVLQYTLRQLGE